MKRFMVFMEIPDNLDVPRYAGDLQNLCYGIDDGQVKGTVHITEHPKLIELADAIGSFLDTDDTVVIPLVERLMAEDWTGSGVYEALDETLKRAESAEAIVQELEKSSDVDWSPDGPLNHSTEQLNNL